VDKITRALSNNKQVSENTKKKKIGSSKERTKGINEKVNDEINSYRNSINNKFNNLHLINFIEVLGNPSTKMKLKDIARLRPYIHKQNKIDNEKRLKNIFRHKYSSLLNKQEFVLPSIGKPTNISM